MTFARRLLRRARSDGRCPSLPTVLRTHADTARRAALLVKIAYFFPLYWALSRISHWQALVLSRDVDRLWPVVWLDWVNVEAVGSVLYATLIAGLSIGALASHIRSARVLAFVSLLELLAMEFSFGKIHHLMHGWLFALFLWIFLPRNFEFAERVTRSRIQAMLLVFSATQLAVAMTYSLSGLGKLLGGVYQLAIGEPNVFGLDAMARHVADRIQFTGEPSVLGPAVVALGALGWPLMLGNVCFQVLALWFALRPAAHRLLGAYLVAFHASSALILTIDFSPQVMLVGILFAASPFAPRRQTLSDILRQSVHLAPRREVHADKPRRVSSTE